LTREDPFNLRRFVRAQDSGGTYATAVEELRAGRKVEHWMWFVFPQLAGLAPSAISRSYAISGLPEAHAYLAHPVLGDRLRECSRILTELQDRSAVQIFGCTDAKKLRSCMTLFSRAAADEGVFRDVLLVFFDGAEDDLTLDRL
jgi:uncharacterized protein (DUF1810 family)